MRPRPKRIRPLAVPESTQRTKWEVWFFQYIAREDRWGWVAVSQADTQELAVRRRDAWFEHYAAHGHEIPAWAFIERTEVTTYAIKEIKK